MVTNQTHDNNDDKNNITPDWYYETIKYATPSLPKAIIQLLDTFIPYITIWVLMIYSVTKNLPYWITLILTILAAALLVRIFIIFHDCCHHSFFASRKANRICGYICGIITCTPYTEWQWTHAKHHATAADLDNRGYGSVWTMTVDEYLTASKFTRFRYRLFRNPLVLFGISPWVLFVFLNRFSSKASGKPQNRSVLITNIAVIIISLLIMYFIGFWNFLKIAAPIIVVSSTIGVWLFYIQHQFEGVYWARHNEWSRLTAALKGCSYYKLPKVLQWITANIGIHHVHHLRTAIPNYNLQKCYDETPQVQDINPITLRKSLKSLFLNLWDEDSKRLVSFRSLKIKSQ